MVEKGPQNEPQEISEQEKAELLEFQNEKDKELRGSVEKECGKENLEVIENLSKSFDQMVKHQALEDPKKAEEALAVWRDFINATYLRLFSENLHDPKMVETALRTATAMVQAEINKAGEDAAEDGLELLKKRYG
ncbi:MAG: hypothetical protein NTW46_03960 [Candidatus Nealsonbacteria bacterium]|nr:hypothetical protein [Candidatus Nealsonbacteria bacterium]